MALRPYQQEAIELLREKFRKGLTRIFYQLATGGGKTVIFTEITRLAFERDLRVWIVVPRRKLVRQASSHLARIKIPHGRINADCKESVAYKVHVVSRDTLMRRIPQGRVKRYPDIIIIDEAHTGLEQQIRIRDAAPENTIIIGVSATPEKADGRGLKECPALRTLNPTAENGLYQDIIYGPDFSYLVSANYLCNFNYFSLPDFRHDKIKKKGGDYDKDSIELILASRQVYGNAISHYRKLGYGKPTLVFCPSVKNAEETAQRFRDAGFKFESIDGTLTEAKIEKILEALENGTIDGITSCELVTYGLDIPSIKCIIMLRKTMSRALYFQMLGRGTRPDGDRKLVVLDHVDNFSEHADGFVGPDDHISKAFDVEWNFAGTEKNKRKKGETTASLKLCESCFLYYQGTTCPHCGTERGSKPQKKYEEIEGRLVEIKGPIKLQERPIEEQREVQDKIGNLVDQCSDGGIDPGAIGELLGIAKDLGYGVMWVYWKLSKDRLTVNVPLLHEMRRQININQVKNKLKPYSPGWIYMQTTAIRSKLGRG